MEHSSGMRIVIVLALMQACGGKLWIEEADGAGPGSVTVPDAPAPSAPDASTSGKPVCEPPVQWTPDFGNIDVTRLGCACRVHEDCEPSEMCIEFPGVDHPRCARTTDPCSLITCRGHAACVVTATVPALPACYR